MSDDIIFEAQKKSDEVHHGKYKITKVNKTKKGKEITYICPIHGEQKQLLSVHIRSYGCKYCGWDKHL